jgi:hypothetical protein
MAYNTKPQAKSVHGIIRTDTGHPSSGQDNADTIYKLGISILTLGQAPAKRRSFSSTVQGKVAPLQTKNTVIVQLWAKESSVVISVDLHILKVSGD